MPLFDPKVGDTITVFGNSYTFVANPQLPTTIHSVAGRFGYIQRMRYGSQEFALKHFYPSYQAPGLAYRNMLLTQFRGIEGLKALDRKTILSNWPPATEIPDLTNGVIMPWICGKEWCEYLGSGIPLFSKNCLSIAVTLVNLLANLEKIGIAHCNLSGNNLIIENDDFAKVQLVSLENLYYRNLPFPEIIPGGSLGYTPAWCSNNNQGLYSLESDRFSGAILLVEILCWQFSDIRNKNYCESSYFDQKEIGKNSNRYQLLNNYLTSIDSNLGHLLSQAWHANHLTECPTIGQWKMAIEKIQWTSSNNLDNSCPYSATPTDDSMLIGIDQSKETNLQEVNSNTSISIRYAYFRSKDAREFRELGQDYLTFRLTQDKVVFAICDGALSSFKGEVAARMVGDFLIKELFNDYSLENKRIFLKESLAYHENLENIVSHFENGLNNLCEEVTRIINEADLSNNNEWLKVALENQRSVFGSQTNFACGLIEMPNENFPKGYLLLIWLGNIKFRLYYGIDDRTDLLEGKFDPNGGWSSKTGITDGPIQAFLDVLDPDFTLIAHSDGLFPFPTWDYKPHVTGVLENNLEELIDNPQNKDDVSFIEISVLKESESNNPNFKNI